MSRSRLRVYFPLLVMCVLVAGCGGFQGVVTPTLSSISPATVAAGSAGFTLTANGSNFVSGTAILWDGVALTTTMVSSSQLTAAVSAAQIADAGTVSIRVIKPDTTTSSPLQLTITGGTSSTFSLTSISPSSVAAGSAAFTLTATGVGFAANDVIALNGTGLTTTFNSATQLQATVPASSVASPAVIAVTVQGPNNTTTNQLVLAVTGASAGVPPTLTSLNPNTVLSGSPTFTLNAIGTGFVSGSQIVWNGTVLQTTFGSATQLSASIPAAYVANAGTDNVFVLNPDSTISNFLPFVINVSPSTVPTLISISPTKAAVDSPAFTLTLNGTNFAAGAVAYFGSDPLPTTVVSQTQLTAQVPATDLTAIARISVTVQNPSSAASNPLPFWVGINVYYGEVNDLAWDAARNVLYISSPTTSTENPNMVLAIDPNTLVPRYTYTAPANAQPDKLAISSDGQYLYVGLDGSGTVQRLLLPSLTPDISIPLGEAPGVGPYFALDLQAAPGEPQTIAVSLGVSAQSNIVTAQGGVAIFDNAVQRPAVVTPTTQAGDVLLDTIQWGADATALYAADNENLSGDFYQLSVSANGVALVSDSPNYFPTPNLRIHFDNALLYGDDGIAVNPVTPALVGNFVSTGIMVPDSTIGDAYFLGQPASADGSVSYIVQSFNLAAYSPIARVYLSQVEGQPQHLIRWGANGLAFNTQKITNCISTPCNSGDGRLYILSGPFVTQTAP